MGQMDFYLSVLQDIVSQPTAPYHEERVAARIGAYLHDWGIPVTVDDAGNLIAHYQHGPACRPLVLMAHMDHPGFTITSRSDGKEGDWRAVLEGWVARAYFETSVAVRLYSDNWAGTSMPARIVGYAQGGDAQDIELRLRLDDPTMDVLVQPGDFGVWDVPDFELRDGLVYARAIDDLAGCAAILLTLWKIARDGWDTDIYAVFTRAEEVGLVGASMVLHSQALPYDAYIVSLEASPMMPGAVQGAGPVVRVGDRVVTFSQDAELALKIAAYRLGSTVWQPSIHRPPAPATTNVQRQLMSGGHCEASIASMLGYHVTGLAFPLGNYHNMAAESTFAPENIHAHDFVTGVVVLQEAARTLPQLAQVRAEHLAAYEPHVYQIERLRSTSNRFGVALR